MELFHSNRIIASMSIHTAGYVIFIQLLFEVYRKMNDIGNLGLDLMQSNELNDSIQGGDTKTVAKTT